MRKYLLTFVASATALIFIAASASINGSGIIDLGTLDHYANQPIPAYIAKDNTPLNNEITDLGATLGRVLFYDKQLSVNHTIACASCHHQSLGFSDTALASTGVNGVTGRHAMRMTNSRFANIRRFFWDERAPSLEAQTTQPIQDHAEMGFSGQNGDPDLDSLIRKMENLPYYQDLFYTIYGDYAITEERMQHAMAQFIRSIQSFDAKYDGGRAQVQNDITPFPNFSIAENEGKALFIRAAQFDSMGLRTGGGAGCAGCHRPPEFDIANNSQHNGMIHSISGDIDLTNTRSPSLRNVVGPGGSSNGPFMHNGALKSLAMVISHYNQLPREILDSALYFNALDPRLRPNGKLQNLQLTPQEQNSLIAFLQTLTGNNVYTDPRWSDPFDSSGNLSILNSSVGIEEDWKNEAWDHAQFYPNPTTGQVNMELPAGSYQVNVRNISGALLQTLEVNGSIQLNLKEYPAGLYFVQISNQISGKIRLKKVLKY